MRIILSGATSFIGRAAERELSARGHELIPFRHSFIEEELPESADCFIHLAWGGAGSKGRLDKDVQESNVDMSVAALRRAWDIGCAKFIFAGSQAEYGHAQDGGLKREDGPAAPVSPYGKAKLRFGNKALEEVLRLNAAGPAGRHMDFIHLRFFSVYGPGDHEGSLISSLIRTLKAGRTMELSDCLQLWNFLYIDDAARALSLIAGTPGVSGTINVASPDTRPLKEYVEEAARIAAGEEGLKLLNFGVRESNAEGPSDLSPDISKISAMGFKPRYTFSEGIRTLL